MRAPKHDRKYRRYQPCQVVLKGHVGGFRWYGLGIVVLLLVTALTYVWCRSGQEKTGRKVERLRRQFAVKAREAENLRMELERFRRGDYILAEVRRRGMNLRPADPRQVRRVRLNTPRRADEFGPESMVAAN